MKKLIWTTQDLMRYYAVSKQRVHQWRERHRIVDGETWQPCVVKLDRDYVYVTGNRKVPVIKPTSWARQNALRKAERGEGEPLAIDRNRGRTLPEEGDFGTEDSARSG